ncbi:MAG: DUF11 domain-containing protein, partial [Pseudomonadota bacterium]
GGTTFLTYTGGSVAAGSTCTIEVPVMVPLATASGDYVSQSSSLTLSGPIIIPPAIANISVQSTQIELAKEFTDDPVVAGGSANLRYTISNLSATGALSSAAFTDDLSSLPTGTTFASTTSDGCSATIGGTGTSSISISNVALAAGASCVIDLAISIPGAAATGSFVSTTSGLTGTIGGLAVTGTAASDTLVINDVTLTFAKSFAPATVAVTETSVLTYTITNTSGAVAAALSFNDDIGTAVPGATLSNFQTTCSGASGSGSSLLSFTGGSLPGGSSCTATVDVTIPLTGTAGAFTSTSSVLSSNGIELAPAAAAGLTVLAGADVSVTKTDGVTSVNAGNTVTYTIVASNAGPAPDPSVSLTDTFSSDLACTYTSVAAGGATGNTAAGAGDLSENLSMPAGSSVTYTASCTVSITAAAGTLSNTATVAGSLVDPDSSNNAATDNDTVIVPVPAPGFTKAFGPATVAQGGMSTVTLTIDNSAAGFAATGLDVTDNLPAGMLVATPSNGSTTCVGGTVSAIPGSATASYTGGTVAANASCTVSFDVVADTSGALVNTTGALTSLFGNSGTADATLTVTPAPAPSFAKSFAPVSVEVGDVSTMTLTIDNTAALVNATTGSFSDTFPAGMVLASTPNVTANCTSGASVPSTPVTTSGSFAVSGITIAAGEVCTYTVDVQATTVGALNNTTGALSTSLGPSGTAAATLTSTSAPAPSIAGAFAPATVDPGDASTLTFTLTNASTFIEATGAAFSATLPANLVVASPANDNTTCSAGTVTASGSSISFAGGTLPVNGSCTV